MKSRLFVFAVLFLSAIAARPALADHASDQDTQIDAILRLVDAGISDEVIIKHIQATGFVYDLSADDILELRQKGVTDQVLEAMLDTAIDDSGSKPKQSPPSDKEDGYADSHVSVALSAGWFSPWYHYPYAWGYYYDPFPAYYSFYYYPFSFCHSWGYYGSCSNYYYHNCFAGYRYWDSPWCYHMAALHPVCHVRAPRTDVVEWRTGRGLPNDRPRSWARHDVTTMPPARRDVSELPPRLRQRFEQSQARWAGGSRPLEPARPLPPEHNGESQQQVTSPPHMPPQQQPPSQLREGGPRWRSGSGFSAPRWSYTPPRSTPPVMTPSVPRGQGAPMPQFGGARMRGRT